MTTSQPDTNHPEVTVDLIQSVVDASPLISGTPAEIAEVFPEVRQSVASILQDNDTTSVSMAILMALGVGE